jgi:hypothetical protein
MQLTFGHYLERFGRRIRLGRSFDIDLYRSVSSFRKHPTPCVVTVHTHRVSASGSPSNRKSLQTHSSASSASPDRPLALNKTKGVGHSRGANSLAPLTRNREHLAALELEEGRVRVEEVNRPKKENAAGLS